MDNISLRNRYLGIMEVERHREVEMESQAYEDLEDQSNLKKKQRTYFNEKGNKNSQSEKIIYYALGVLEILSAFRFVFKLLGANTENTFVSILYSLTDFFLAPFTDIFRETVLEGIEVKSIFESTLLIGMIAYAILAWGIVKLIRINNKYKNSESN